MTEATAARTGVIILGASSAIAEAVARRYAVGGARLGLVARDPARLEAIAALWERLRAATRETEAYNLDKKLHVLAIFEEFAARARML